MKPCKPYEFRKFKLDRVLKRRIDHPAGILLVLPQAVIPFEVLFQDAPGNRLQPSELLRSCRFQQGVTADETVQSRIMRQSPQRMLRANDEVVEPLLLLVSQ